MLNALWTIRWATRDYFSVIGEILKDIRLPWDPPALPAEMFAFG